MNQTRETPLKSPQRKDDLKSVHKAATPEQRLDEDYDANRPSVPTPRPKADKRKDSSDKL